MQSHTPAERSRHVCMKESRGVQYICAHAQSYAKKAKKNSGRPRSAAGRIGLCLGLLLGAFAVGRAQSTIVSTASDDIHFGIQAGGGVHTAYPAKGTPWTFEKPKTKVGFSGSAFFEWDFAKSRQWFLHLELGVGSATLQAKGHSADTAYGDFDIKADYIDLVPAVGVGYRFWPRTSTMNLTLLACVVGNFPSNRGGEPYISVNRQNLPDHPWLNSMGLRLECGLHYAFACLALRYEHELLPIMRVSGQKFTMGHFEFLLRFTIF